MVEQENKNKEEVLRSMKDSSFLHDIKIIAIRGGIFSLILFFLFSVGVFIWFFCRIEVESGSIAILIKKTGDDLPSGKILALEPGQKGIQLAVLSEGRYFYNPYHWSWKIHPITDIPAGKLGVKIGMYGKTLQSGEILTDNGNKGIMSDVLSPGKYRINPFAYQVQLFDAIHIRPRLCGRGHFPCR